MPGNIDALMNKLSIFERRKLLLGLAALPLSGLARAVALTPATAEGPFYPVSGMRLADIDNDLVKIEDRVQNAGGEIIWLKGRVLDQRGQAVAGARVEIWQCDLNARYLHWADSAKQPRDLGFQGFGRDLSNAVGQYSFRTIKPVAYPGRTPHIHVKVWVGEQDRLTTQLYLSAHPGNQRDWLYRSIPLERRQQVTLMFVEAAGGPTASIDLVV